VAKNTSNNGKASTPKAKAAKKDVSILDAVDMEKQISDRRIDLIKVAAQMVAYFGDEMKSEVKDTMFEKGAGKVVGEICEATLGKQRKEVPDPGKLYALMKKGAISEKDFLSAITVNKAACEVFMTGRAISQISEVKEVATLGIKFMEGKEPEEADLRAILNEFLGRKPDAPATAGEPMTKEELAPAGA
jgi:hypothetical protein